MPQRDAADLRSHFVPSVHRSGSRALESSSSSSSLLHFEEGESGVNFQAGSGRKFVGGVGDGAGSPDNLDYDYHDYEGPTPQPWPQPQTESWRGITRGHKGNDEKEEEDPSGGPQRQRDEDDYDYDANANDDEEVSCRGVRAVRVSLLFPTPPLPPLLR